MSGPYYIGIDGGGTKTHFTLIDRDRHVLAEHDGDTTYHLQVGVDGVERVLAEGLAALVNRIGVGFDAIDHVFVGLPAYGEDSLVDPVLARLPAKLLGHDRYTCRNDMVCGWAGSLGGEDGINVVAGTGSIGYGERDGRSARAGGWGEVFSDEGSAHWIAVQGLNSFTRMSDGRSVRTGLYDIFRLHFGISSDIDICARVMGEQAISRSEVASLSRLVTRAAANGDAAAQEILAHAARELALIADAVRRALGYAPGETVPISYSGGVFDAGAVIVDRFAQALAAIDAGFALRAPLHTPSMGAALYALRQAMVRDEVGSL